MKHLFRMAVVVAAAFALPLSAQVTTYDLEGPSPQFWSFDITVGHDGALWYTTLQAGKVGRITVDGDVTNYVVGNDTRRIVAGPDNAVWFLVGTDRVGRMTTDDHYTAFTLPSAASDLATGSDGAIWLAAGSKILRMTTGGVFTEFPHAADKIISGPDGNLWVYDGFKIGRLTPAGAFDSFPLPGFNSLRDMTFGPDGALWFAAYDSIGRLTTAGALTQYRLPAPARSAENLSVGADGTVWFSENAPALPHPKWRIGRLTAAREFAEIMIDSEADDLVVGPDGGIWMTEGIGHPQGGGHLRRLAPATTPDIVHSPTEIGIFRPIAGDWHIRDYKTGAIKYIPNWGPEPNDKPVPGDYDGDGQLDIAVFRPVEGNWYIRLAKNGVMVLIEHWGMGANDIPVPGDYDGDEKTDVAVYRPETNEWFIRFTEPRYNFPPTAHVTDFRTGTGWTPVPADYNGDGQTDLGLYRNGEWQMRNLPFYYPYGASYTESVLNFGGQAGDIPVPADYDGNRKADVAIFRPIAGDWHMRRADGTNGFVANFGPLQGDIPVPGDYDNDWKDDIAIFRPGTGEWFILKSSDQQVMYVPNFGPEPNDKPIPKYVAKH